MAAKEMHRRSLTLALAATAAGPALGSDARAHAPSGRVDVHHHPIPPEWVADPVVLAALAPNVRARAQAWTPQAALDEMDRNGVRTAVCSVANPGVWFGDASHDLRLARSCNDYFAHLAEAHPGRFGVFAALPLPDVDGSLKEIARAYDRLGVDGVGLFTSYGDRWLADPAFAPVFAELNRRSAVVYVHPTAPACCRSLLPGVPSAVLEYPIDTSRTMLQWLLSDADKRYPALKLIFSHDGGLFMSGVGRLDILSETQPDLQLRRDLPVAVRKFYYETSSSADARSMNALRAYVPYSQVLLGTDSPFIGSMRPNLAQFERLPLPARERAAIEHGNALALMPHLQRGDQSSSAAG